MPSSEPSGAGNRGVAEEGAWASSLVQRQHFAVVVQLEHEAQIELYQRVRIRLNV